MARFGVNDADKYGGQGGAGYLSLKNHGDVAKVRFLINGIEDVEGFAVHEVEIDGKKRYVNCLREYGQPLDVCPFCAAKIPTQVKYFMPVYNITEDRVQTWERGKKFGAKISSICSRYPNLVSHTFEIERNGQAGDTNTTYEIYETGSDDTTLENFEEFPEVMGTIVLDKTPDDMVCYLNAGYFPDANAPAQRGPQQPVIRRGGAPSNDVTRRTPATANGNGGARREVF